MENEKKHEAETILDITAVYRMIEFGKIINNYIYQVIIQCTYVNESKFTRQRSHCFVQATKGRSHDSILQISFFV
jgi:hypothetical protein